MASTIEILTGKRGFQRKRGPDVSIIAEVVGQAGGRYSIRTLGSSPVSLGDVDNGTTDTFHGGDLVRVSYSGGDRGAGQISAKIRGRQRSAKLVVV